MTPLLFFVSAGGIGWLLAQTLLARFRRQRARARAKALTAGLWVLLYAAALGLAAALSRPRELTPGTQKCFDEWCATLDPVSAGGVLRLTVANQGRGPQRPDTPRAAVRCGERLVPIQVPGLDERLEAHGTRALDLELPRELSRPGCGLEVTEGGWPTPLFIDDENSPGHARSFWLLGGR
jgi:hypothetical protein